MLYQSMLKPASGGEEGPALFSREPDGRQRAFAAGNGPRGQEDAIVGLQLAYPPSFGNRLGGNPVGPDC